MGDTDVEQCAEATLLNTFLIPLFQGIKIRNQHCLKCSKLSCVFLDTDKDVQNNQTVYKSFSAHSLLSILPLLNV